MRDNTYHRWMTMVGGDEPLWPVARAQIRALTPGHVREPDGGLLEWTLIDEVLGLEARCEDVAAELATVRAQLLADLDLLVECWNSGHPDVSDGFRDGGRQLFAGGGLGPDWEYPNAMTGCLARLIGSGTARAAGFLTDEDEVT